MYAVGVLDDLVDVVGKGILFFMQGIHLKRTTTLAGYTVVIPPRELRDEDLGIRCTSLAVDREEIVDGILQHVLTTISQKHLTLIHTIDFTEAYRDNALLALVVDTGVETQCLRIEILDSLHHFLAGLKIKFVSVEIIHFNLLFDNLLFTIYSSLHFHECHADGNPDDFPYAADDTHKDT